MLNSGPFLLIIGPLVGAAATGLAAMLPVGAARWRPAALAGLGLLLAVALGLLLALADGEAWVVYGRSLLLTPEGRTLCLGLLLLLAASYALALVWPAPDAFVPLSLAAVSPLAAMVMIRPFALGALFLLLAAALLAPVLATGRPGSAGTAWRYLVMVVAALPLFLLAGWLAAAPAVLPWGAARVLAAAALLVLGGFPFVLWVRPAARQAAPLVRPFLFGGVQWAMVGFLLGWLAASPDWQVDPGFQAWLRWSGGATALLGGLLAALARDRDELVASLLLLDLGLGILTLLLPGAMGWQTAVALFGGRSVALLLLGAAELLLAGRASGGRSRPWALALWAYGCLTLLGLPLTVGFAGRWALLGALPGLSDGPGGGVLVGLLLLALAAGLGGVGRRVWPPAAAAPPKADVEAAG